MAELADTAEIAFIDGSDAKESEWVCGGRGKVVWWAVAAEDSRV